MNTQLAIRTEFSLKTAYGTTHQIIQSTQAQAIGICDRASTWGHVRFGKACLKEGKTPLYGVELAVCPDMDRRTGRNVGEHCYMRLIAKNEAGLSEMYQLVSLATEKKFYIPRIDYTTINNVSDNLFVLLGMNPNFDLLDVDRDNFYFELSPSTLQHLYWKAYVSGIKFVVTSNNFYPEPDDKGSYEVLVGGRGRNTQTYYQAIMEDTNLLPQFIDKDDVVIGLAHNDFIASECKVSLPQAEMVKPEKKQTLREMCIDGAAIKGVDLTDQVYEERLNRELDLFAKKGFEDYFYVVADLVNWSKERMLIGTARGSSCGSLVCHLLNITNVDPIPYKLLLERFVDENRDELPDIDIDFPDHARPMVIEYLQKKYGNECVATLGTVNFMRPKSAVIDAARELCIPRWEIEPFKESIDIETKNAVESALVKTREGMAIREKYPEIEVACSLEGHARHSGVHAAGVLITEDPISRYASKDNSSECVMIDKRDAEDLNLLKIDILGLRTLTVIEDCLEMVGMSYQEIESWPLDDPKAYQVLNDGNFAGIFQFEGNALKNLCRQMEVVDIEDIASLTALCRPGALASGGADEYLKHKNNPQKVEYFHPKMEEFTKETFGVLVYQEQVMWVAREIGNLSWPRVSALRRAISKSMGMEAMEGFRVEFEEGANANGMESLDITVLWQNMVTMGGYAFNRSHAVAYAIMSYWCMVLKAHHPLEFACATLRHPKDEDQSVDLLRDVGREGVQFVSVCAERSEVAWSIHDGVLVGGFKGLKGVGDKLAAQMVERRKAGRDFTKRQKQLIADDKTPWKNIFDCHKKWSHLFADPEAYRIQSGLTEIANIPPDQDGLVVCVLCRVESFTKRDMNEPHLVERRGNRMTRDETRFLQVELGDDTGKLKGILFSDHYRSIGDGITKAPKETYYLVKGVMSAEYGSMTIERCAKITNHKGYESKKVEA